MIIKVLIPQAFENMEEATIGRWLKNEGDAVRGGDALCELITEKTTFDLPAEEIPGSGVLLRSIVVPEKSIVPVGTCIALLGTADDDLPDVAPENAKLAARRQSAASRGAEESTPALRVPSLQSAPAGVTSTPAGGASRIRATPAARRAARERGVAIEAVAAAFPGKVLTEDDVANFAA
jgi:pyruvate dehydrogenase E2 component (dihydrolipoamide acetyltransferase)